MADEKRGGRSMSMRVPTESGFSHTRGDFTSLAGAAASPAAAEIGASSGTARITTITSTVLFHLWGKCPLLRKRTFASWLAQNALKGDPSTLLFAPIAYNSLPHPLDERQGYRFYTEEGWRKKDAKEKIGKRSFGGTTLADRITKYVIHNRGGFLYFEREDCADSRHQQEITLNVEHLKKCKEGKVLSLGVYLDVKISFPQNSASFFKEYGTEWPWLFFSIAGPQPKRNIFRFATFERVFESLETSNGLQSVISETDKLFLEGREEISNLRASGMKGGKEEERVVHEVAASLQKWWDRRRLPMGIRNVYYFPAFSREQGAAHEEQRGFVDTDVVTLPRFHYLGDPGSWLVEMRDAVDREALSRREKVHKVASQFFGKAFYILYLHFHRLTSGEKGDGRAEECLHDSAEMGHRDSLYELARIAKKKGEKASYLNWLLKAANAGHAEAQYEYADAIVAKKAEGSLEEAKNFYKSAANSGHEGARREYMLFLKNHLGNPTPDELEGIVEDPEAEAIAQREADAHLLEISC